MQAGVPDVRVFLELRGFLLGRGYPPSPPPPLLGYFGSKLSGFNDLQEGSVRKILKTGLLRPKYLLSITWQRNLDANPFFLIYISIISVWVQLTCHPDVIGLWRVRWFWGLTCDFWVENAENNFGAKQRQWNHYFVSQLSILD
jgi:hypothetical protein